MAIVFAQSSKALDLLETAISSVLIPTVVVRSLSEVILDFDHGFVDEIYGTGLFFSEDTAVVTGVIDRIVERREGILTFTISDIAVPLESLLTWFDEGDSQAFNLHVLDGADYVVGSDFEDRLHTFAGNDIVVANGGDDEVDAGSGNDYVDAGSGDDLVYGGDGNDSLDGGVAGADELFGGGGNDTVSHASSQRGVIVNLQTQVTWDGIASDRLEDIESAIGSRFDDKIWGSNDDNVLDGGAGGSDDLFGYGGNDTVSYASSGQSVIVDLQAQGTWDGLVSDRLESIENVIGSRFDDKIWGTRGDNVLDGGAGGSDDLFGQGGNDTVSYGSSGQGVIVDLRAQGTWDGLVSDRLADIENAIGSRLDDQIWGSNDDNVLDGGAGGSDDLFGYGGNDTVSYGSSDRGVTINLEDQRTWDGLNTDRLQGIENATGSEFADVIYGSSLSNKFTGGAGTDLFVLGSSWGHDEILDFNTGEDKIRISSRIFASFYDLIAHSYSANGHAVIQIDQNNTLTFNIGTNILSSSDFLFV